MARKDRPDPADWARVSEEERERREQQERLRAAEGAVPSSQRQAKERQHGRFNRLAVTAFVIAMLPVVLGAPIAAIVLGWLAQEEIEDGEYAERGHGLATWAFYLGVFWTVIYCLAIIVIFALVFD